MSAAWTLGVAANAVAAIAFLAVAAVLATNAIRTRQVRNNPLGLATVVLYITCGGGHVVHTMQLLDGTVLAASTAGAAIRLEYENNWHMWLIDIVTAAAGVSYWLMRKRFPALVSGAAVFEDLRARQRRALEIHDNVVQGLAEAKMALDMGMQKQGDAAVAQTLDKARAIITNLLGDEDVASGSVRRRQPGQAGGDTRV